VNAIFIDISQQNEIKNESKKWYTELFGTKTKLLKKALWWSSLQEQDYGSISLGWIIREDATNIEKIEKGWREWWKVLN
jgi:hypothetical protein